MPPTDKAKELTLKTRKVTSKIIPALLPVILSLPASATGGAVDSATTAKKMVIEETLVNCYREKGDLPGAASEYAKLVAIEPNNARVHFDYGNVLLRLQRMPQAAAQYEKAAKLDPSVPEFLGGAATGCMINKNYDGAKAYFRKAVQKGGKYQTQLDELEKLNQPVGDFDKTPHAW